MRVVTSVLAGLVLATTVSTPAAYAAEEPVGLVIGVRGQVDLPAEATATGTLPGALTVDVPRGEVTEVAEELRADPDVAYVEPDHIAHAAAVVTPNDPYYPQQWGIAKTRVNTAWTATRGSTLITVAVVDTGVKRITDFGARLLPGYDFVNKDSDPTDDDGHGTMTAQVIGASANNHVGVTGICWSCRILPVKVLGAGGIGSYSDIAAGIRYAADRGADVINLSLGGAADSRLMRDAVAYATSKNAVVIAAAGNEGSAAPHYPAAIPSVLAVGASTPGDARYPWSNYGASWVDLAAPGCNPAVNLAGVLSDFCGTSSSTPFASGVAALLATARPGVTPAKIRDVLTATSVKLAGNWLAASSGRIDAAAAVGTVRGLAIDQAGPVVRVTRAAASGARVAKTTPFGVAATDPSGVTRLELIINGKITQRYAGRAYVFAVPVWKFGKVVRVQARAYDRFGNARLTPTRTWYR
ncbi:S8 family serine peptidase [Actinoplanes sp. NBRC 103695]|uniref:S8 family serine peptidase n=1 Tax=Actinoplanes sp. NBRC 103695 TaxID=3032202 RepID=UPI0025525938|nr:S8 family serine peptidase [Actinoplanes sp. NBRC 103695]